MNVLRAYVRDLLDQVINVLGDGTNTLQQSYTLKADTMRASTKIDSCNSRTALQILQNGVGAA